MEKNSRKSIYDKLSKYDYLENDENAFIEVTQWTNGEGYDINFGGSTGSTILNTISLTEGQLDAINYLVKSLQYAD